MEIKEKGWLWKLTWPFAHNNFTTIWDTIYCPKNMVPDPKIRRHEAVHYWFQQKKWTRFGLPLWIFLYLAPNYPFLVWILLWIFAWQEALMLTPIVLGIGLPVLWNPWRWRWEYEAYTKGSGLSHDETVKILRSRAYGWLILNGRGFL